MPLATNSDISADKSIINEAYLHFGQYLLHQIKTNMNEWRKTKETFTVLLKVFPLTPNI